MSSLCGIRKLFELIIKIVQLNPEEKKNHRLENGISIFTVSTKRVSFGTMKAKAQSFKEGFHIDAIICIWMYKNLNEFNLYSLSETMENVPVVLCAPFNDFPFVGIRGMCNFMKILNASKCGY